MVRLVELTVHVRLCSELTRDMQLNLILMCPQQPCMSGLTIRLVSENFIIHNPSHPDLFQRSHPYLSLACIEKDQGDWGRGYIPLS